MREKYDFSEVHQHAAGRALPGKARYHNPSRVEKICAYEPTKISLVRIDEYDRTAKASMNAMIQFYVSIHVGMIEAQLRGEVDKEKQASELLRGISRELNRYTWKDYRFQRKRCVEIRRTEKAYQQKAVGLDENNPIVTRLAAIREVKALYASVNDYKKSRKHAEDNF